MDAKWKSNSSHYLQINELESELSSQNVCKLQGIHNLPCFMIYQHLFYSFGRHKRCFIWTNCLITALLTVLFQLCILRSLWKPNILGVSEKENKTCIKLFFPCKGLGRQEDRTATVSSLIA